MLAKLLSKIIQFRANCEKLGIFNAIKSLLTIKGKNTIIGRLKKPSPTEFYKFIYAEKFGEENSSDESSRTLNWVIPDFNIGSGGHLNIFRIVKKLEERGFTCRIIIDGHTNFHNADQARSCIRENFFPIDATVSIGRQSMRPAAATFATSWITAYTVRDFRGAGKRYYLVQDFEPFFYALGSDYTFAEETYNFGFKGITAGKWLAEKLHSEYKMQTIPFGFSYDKDLYRYTQRRAPEKKRVFFYARSVTPRRAFELGLLALNLVYKKDPSIEFILAGWDTSSYDIPFPHLNAGVVAIKDLPDLYSQCDVALVLSLTNLSLLPLELMACNCAVISNSGGNVEWLLNDKVARFCRMTPEDISDGIVDLFSEPDELETLKESGREFANLTSWESEVDRISTELQRDLLA